MQRRPAPPGREAGSSSWWSPKIDSDCAASARATGDPEADRLAALDGRRAGAFVNVAGKKEMSDFYFPGLAKQGPVVAGVTAGGTDHRLAKRMTEAVQKCLEREMTGGEIER